MSIEENLERIAAALEKLADNPSWSNAGTDAPAKPASKPKASKPKASKPKAVKPEAAAEPAVETETEFSPLDFPENGDQLKKLVISQTRGMVPEKMAKLGKMIRDDYNVNNIVDLPAENYEGFIDALNALVNS